MKETIECKLISEHYSDRVAKRSQVPLINHINEGLAVLDRIGATEYAKQAFCIHPLLQADNDLRDNFNAVAFAVSPAVVMLAMEYRSVANEYLSMKVGTGHKIRLSPLYEVNDMLVADKVQNYKDFITYHSATHPRSAELDIYFNEWLEALRVPLDSFQRLCNVIDESKL